MKIKIRSQRRLVWGTCALRPGWTDDVLMNCTRLEYFTIINICQFQIPLWVTLSDGVTSSYCPSLKFLSQMRRFTALEIILTVKLKCNVAQKRV